MQSETSHDNAIPRFECNKLMFKNRIGQGSLGDVYTTDYRAPGKITTETVVIKKMSRALLCKNQTYRGKDGKFDFFLILMLDRLGYN